MTKAIATFLDTFLDNYEFMDRDLADKARRELHDLEDKVKDLTTAKNIWKESYETCFKCVQGYLELQPVFFLYKGKEK